VSMKVFNLCCEREHTFEGWFASAEAFESQLANDLLECPFCASKQVRRLPSAPRLNLGTAGQEHSAIAAKSDISPAQVQEMWMKMARYIQANTENVGEQFAEEARRIHYNEAPDRAIRGQTSQDEARELAEEGIEIFSFPMPKLPEGPLQ
jgi:hypothetical protein